MRGDERRETADRDPVTQHPKKRRKKYTVREKVAVAFRDTVQVVLDPAKMESIYAADPDIARFRDHIRRQQALLHQKQSEVDTLVEAIEDKIKAIKQSVLEAWKQIKVHRREIKAAKKILEGNKESAVIRRMERNIVGRKNYLNALEGRRQVAAGKIDLIRKLTNQPIV